MAHGNPANARWLLLAACGALLATTLPAALWSRAVGGDPFTALPLPLIVSWMLAAQMVAHVALAAAGADPHAGVTGSLALHVLLAVVSAVLIRRFELRLVSAQAAARGPLCEPAPDLPRPPRRDALRSFRLTANALGRAPPRAA